MLKSLYAGVSGLQSHQVAMDVESNNIANVNTTGFKYSRANFSNLLAQTKSIATAPQGDLGGKNAVQVGLGSTVSSMTTIYSQGSIQNSDKNTDVAIQGDGFFIVSSDAGNTYKYTRAGDFKFDANGNFVDNNGFVTQGWLRDPITKKVDSTAPITNINIPPGLTTPASPTAEVVLKANLNSGPLVESFSPAYSLKSDAVTIEPAAQDSNNTAVASGDLGVMFNEAGKAFSLQANQGIWASYANSTIVAPNAVTSGGAGLDITFDVDPELNHTTPLVNQVTITAADTGSDAGNASAFVAAINAQSAITGIVASASPANVITLVNTNALDSASHNINLTVNAGDTSGLATDSSVTAYRYQYTTTTGVPAIGGDDTFHTMAELRSFMQTDARNLGTTPANNGITIEVDEAGKFKIKNPNSTADDYDMNLKITSYVDQRAATSVTENPTFSTTMKALNSVLSMGSAGTAYSQSLNAATHSSSIDIFDSLGSKHTLRMEFRKVTLDKSTGSTWDMVISVPSPATIDTAPPVNEKTGSVRFNNDGSISSLVPGNISFSGNNGSAPEQQVKLQFGTINAFDGMTSFDSRSSTSGISQDGFTGGDLVGIRIDQSGTIVGSFSNGRSFGLAQIAMSKFTNNEGLATEGGNIFIQTANSGDPTIGTAATSGRGFIQSAALEASNVDLSRSLTQLIIIQRGYQANGKTITTSDQLLETLIGLKR